jgi:hypothetical protein
VREEVWHDADTRIGGGIGLGEGVSVGRWGQKIKVESISAEKQEVRHKSICVKTSCGSLMHIYSRSKKKK